MMISNIVPTDYLEYIPKVRSRVHLALAHIVEGSPYYASFFRYAKERGDITILDNSVFELGDKAYSSEELVEISLKINATYAMAPENFDSVEKHLEEVCRFAELAKAKNLKTMAVIPPIEGISISSIQYLCRKLLAAGVEAFGFSCLVDPDFGSRSFFIDHPNDNIRLALSRFFTVKSVYAGTIGMYEKAYIHLLGMNHPYELSFYSDKCPVDSVDTSCAYMYAKSNVSLEDPSSIKPKSLINFEDSYDATLALKTLDNIDVLERYFRRNCLSNVAMSKAFSKADNR